MGNYIIPMTTTANQQGYVSSANADYATARSGGTLAYAGSYLYFGQNLSEGTYTCYEAFCKFDTSVIPDDEEVLSARLTLHLAPASDYFGTDCIVEARAKDWGAAVTTADWVAGASLGDDTLVATWDTARIRPASYQVNNFSETAAFKDAINKTGDTKLILSSRRIREGTTPSAEEWGRWETSRVYLTVVTATANKSEVQHVGAGVTTTIGTAQSFTSAIDVSPPLGCAAGDLIVAYWATGKHSISVPAGWTLIQQATDDANYAYACAYRFATADDIAGAFESGPAYVFGDDHTGYSAFTTAFYNVNPESPVGASAIGYNASNTTVTAPTITQNVADALILFASCGISTGGACSSYAIASDDPGGWVQRGYCFGSGNFLSCPLPRRPSWGPPSQS